MDNALRGLYVITDRTLSPGRDHLDIARTALECGVSIIQFRDKTLPTRQAVETARALRRLTRDHGALLMINDRCDVAAVVEADGVHLGQDDMPLGAARELLGPDVVIGLSVDTPEEAVGASRAGADYISLGPIFSTATKEDAGPVVGLDILRETRARMTTPIAAIGGISLTNAADVARAGADMVCVISAIAKADDMKEATRRLMELIGSVR